LGLASKRYTASSAEIVYISELPSSVPNPVSPKLYTAME